MLKIILEVPEDTSDEDCDLFSMKVREWLQSDKEVLPLRGLSAHVFDYQPQGGALVDVKVQPTS